VFHPPPSIADLLSDVPWVGSLPPHARDRLTAETYDTHHRKGDAVVRVGDPARSWIYVADGLLKVSALDRGGRTIMFTGVPTGGWIGEGAAIKREPRRYQISAMRDTRLLHVPVATVRWLLDSSLEFNRAIIAQLNERLSQYITMVEIDRMHDPVARVARSLAVLFNPVLYPNMTAAVPFSQQELGELAGLSRQSVSIALRQLQTEGHVSTEYHGVVVKNVEALRLREDGGEQ
jgi:CRP-like cAMP-binding protein